MNTQNNTTRIEIPENWGMYMQRIDEKPSVTRVNLALYDSAPYSGYQYRIQLAVYYKNQTESGLPTSEENPQLWEIEDAFVELLKQVDAIDVGLMKWNNRLNFFFYVKKPEGMEAKFIDNLKQQFPDYKYKLWVDEDNTWECYFETLYPDKYGMQEIKNNQVLNALLKHNDNLEKERQIDHYLFFKDEETAHSFLETVEKEGFKETAHRTDEGEELPVMTCISRVDIADDIHDITWHLLDIAENFGGDYDGWESPIATD